jgi:hypothetical protein
VEHARLRDVACLPGKPASSTTGRRVGMLCSAGEGGVCGKRTKRLQKIQQNNGKREKDNRGNIIVYASEGEYDDLRFWFKSLRERSRPLVTKGEAGEKKKEISALGWPVGRY